MTLGNTPPDGGHDQSARPHDDRYHAPPTDRRKMAAAGVLLMIPIVALMWVPSYTRVEPVVLGFPFFFWYQFLWVFLCSAMTYAAFRLTLSARGKSPRQVGEDR